MAPQSRRIRVENLRSRAEANYDIRPGTNEETALRFLASHPKWAYPPATIAAETSIPARSAAETMTRLRDTGAVTVIDGYYFIPKERLEAVRGLLGDLHHINQMPPGDDYVPVHPTNADTHADVDDGDSDDADSGPSPTVADYDPDSGDESAALLNSPDEPE